MPAGTRAEAVPASVRDRLARIFPGEQIALVGRVDAMAVRFDALTDQRPATCGAYALSYLLEPLGFARRGELDLRDEDALAHLAGVVIEDYEVQPSEAVAARVRSGELSEAAALEQFRKVWYRYPVRASDDPVTTGTSAMGVARAIAVGTDGALGTVPIPGRRGGSGDGDVQLTTDRWEALFDLLAEKLDDWDIHVVFNYEVDHLLKPNHPGYTADALRSPDAIKRLARDDWHVGHFVGLAGMWRRPWGERWLMLFDTYKERGFDGYQPQPAELMRQGLVREDGRGGGLLIVLPAARLADGMRAIENLGLAVGPWDNGSPDPDDWQWEPGR
jgi:hypothetical protein